MFTLECINIPHLSVTPKHSSLNPPLLGAFGWPSRKEYWTAMIAHSYLCQEIHKHDTKQLLDSILSLLHAVFCTTYANTGMHNCRSLQGYQCWPQSSLSTREEMLARPVKRSFTSPLRAGMDWPRTDWKTQFLRVQIIGAWNTWWPAVLICRGTDSNSTCWQLTWCVSTNHFKVPCRFDRRRHQI